MIGGFTALAMASLDTAIANIALPAIAADLHVSPAEAVWVVNVSLRSMYGSMEDAMTDNVKLPRKLPDERQSPRARRPSHEEVIDQLERWANSPGLQPPGIAR